jgi:hypothetical protein
MNPSSVRKILYVNLAYWFVAVLVHPAARLMESAAGRPVKILEFFIPMFFIALAAGSTYMIKSALAGTSK